MGEGTMVLKAAAVNMLADVEVRIDCEKRLTRNYKKLLYIGVFVVLRGCVLSSTVLHSGIFVVL